MVLKDNGGLVKMYALVDVEKYNIVATGTAEGRTCGIQQAAGRERT